MFAGDHGLPGQFENARRLKVQEAGPEEDDLMKSYVMKEMEDDPQWRQDIAFTWDSYFRYVEDPKVFATSTLIIAYVEETGRTVIVYQKTAGGDYEQVWEEPGLDLETEPLRVCLANLHYQLLVPILVKKPGSSAVKNPVVCLKRPAGNGLGCRKKGKTL